MFRNIRALKIPALKSSDLTMFSYLQATSGSCWENRRTLPLPLPWHHYNTSICTQQNWNIKLGIVSELVQKISEKFLKWSGQSNLGIISGETVAFKLSSREFCNSWYKSVNIYLFIYHKLSLNKRFVYNPEWHFWIEVMSCSVDHKSTCSLI